MYDAGAKHHGFCLNEAISPGPKLHNELFSVFVMFKETNSNSM